VRAKHWVILYWSWMVLLTAAFYARPSWHIPVWSVIGLTGATAVVVGVIRNRPRLATPWVLLAISLVSFAAGDTTYNLLTSVGHQVNPFPSIADVFYLITCATQIAGMVGLVRAGTASRDRSALLDSLVLTSGVGVLYWIFVISPRIHDPQPGVVAKIISITYPLTDVLLLALVARLVVVYRRTPAVLLLAIGIAGLLEADIAYDVGQLNASWRIGGPVDIGWIVLYAAVGAAALHPSMVTLTSPRTAPPLQLRSARLLLLTISALVAPATLIIESARGNVHDVTFIAVLSSLVFVLVMFRLSGALASNRLSLGRERALLRASDAMVAATEVTDVRATIEAAVPRMVPHGTAFAVDVVEGIEPPLGPRPVNTSAADAELRYVASLGPRLPSAFRRFELALTCLLPTRDTAHRHAGSVFVVLGADEDTLSTMKAPLEVLTAQARVALERIALTDEVNRRKSEDYFRTLVQNAADVILIVEEDNVVRYASPSAESVFGEQTVVGIPLDVLLDVDDRDRGHGVVELMRRRALTAETADEAYVERVVRRPDGQVVHVEASSRDLTDDVTVEGVVVTLRDVTDRHRLERQLTHHAFHDPLTGVANRLLFQEQVKVAVARAGQHGGLVGVLFVDIDDFKIVNDTMGHHAGDQLLIAVAERLKAVLRLPDSVARLGGDEFAALVEDTSDPADVEAVATEISAALSEPFFVGDVLVSGVASIGVATTADAVDEQDLLRQADLALYVAKGSGKGQWRRYQSDLHTAILKRMQVRTELDQAIKDGAFEVRYQPIVQLAAGRTVGFEALVRWVHPQSGLIQPSDFIDIAEESGLIVPLGDWIMQTAITAAAAWGDPDSHVSVNVSVRQFRTPGFVDRVRRHLAEAGLPPSRLMVEITESLLLPDEEQVWGDLDALRAIGAKIAIDDFGTGYSSLSYLRRVPIDVVKIDRSFVTTIASSEQDRELVGGIISLAATLKLDVIAEGIETNAERDLLVELGCPMGQGYLFSPPLTQKASVEWLNANRQAA
jgi:diguanylate cyclase (GGDEF)-like protein/PAS domain S-box-containing protein